MSDLSIIPTQRLCELEQIEKRYKLLTQKMSRQGVELADRGGFKIDKSPTQCLVRMDYWCTVEQLEKELDLVISNNRINDERKHVSIYGRSIHPIITCYLLVVWFGFGYYFV